MTFDQAIAGVVFEKLAEAGTVTIPADQLGPLRGRFQRVVEADPRAPVVWLWGDGELALASLHEPRAAAWAIEVRMDEFRALLTDALNAWRA